MERVVADDAMERAVVDDATNVSGARRSVAPAEQRPHGSRLSAPRVPRCGARDRDQDGADADAGADNPTVRNDRRDGGAVVPAHTGRLEDAGAAAAAAAAAAAGEPATREDELSARARIAFPTTPGPAVASSMIWVALK
jgi:hypothetical protein